jgi:hypothetical protein
MADVVYVGIVCAFFALCVIYIRWCDRIIGSDEPVAQRADEPGVAPGSEVSLTSPTDTRVTA